MYVYIYICVYGWGGYHMQNREATTSLVVKILKPNYAPGIRLDTAKNHRELVILLRPCTIFQPSPLHDFCWRFDPPLFYGRFMALQPTCESNAISKLSHSKACSHSQKRISSQCFPPQEKSKDKTSSLQCPKPRAATCSF